MGTDRYAYCSRMRQVDPVAKTVLSISAGAVCLLCGGLAPGLGTLLVMGILTTVWGKIPGRVFVRFLGIPITFLLLGCVTIAVGIYDGNTGGVYPDIGAPGALRHCQIPGGYFSGIFSDPEYPHDRPDRGIAADACTHAAD